MHKARRTRVGACVMAVPEREELAETLKSQLVGQQVRCDVSIDEDRRGPWWNWRRSMLRATEGVEYGVVLQDDVALCGGFVEVLRRVIMRVWDEPLILYTARPSILREARRKRRRLLQRLGCDTAQGIAMPAWLARQAIDWLDENDRVEWSVHDDARLDAWSRRHRRRFVYPFPCLVDHRQDVVSVLKHRHPVYRLWFAGDYALDVDWTSPLEDVCGE